MKNNFPLPEGPSTNLLLLVVTPFLIGRSEMSMCSGFPLMWSAILIPNGDGESIQLASSVKRLVACSMKVWKLSSDGKSPSLPGISVQKSVGQSTVIVSWHTFHACQLTANLVSEPRSDTHQSIFVDGILRLYLDSECMLHAVFSNLYKVSSLLSTKTYWLQIWLQDNSKPTGAAKAIRQPFLSGSNRLPVETSIGRSFMSSKKDIARYVLSYSKPLELLSKSLALLGWQPLRNRASHVPI